MDKKLTLNLNASIINAAKAYAKENGHSLSRIIERYLANLTQREEPDLISPRVKRLTGVIKNREDFNEADEISDYLIKKYK